MKIKRFIGDSKISGGNLPSGFSVKVPLTLDFTGVDLQEAIQLLCDSSSPRVKFCGYARDNWTKEEALEYAETGVTIHVRDCGREVLTPEQARRKAIANLLALMPGKSREEIEKFVDANTPK